MLPIFLSRLLSQCLAAELALAGVSLALVLAAAFIE